MALTCGVILGVNKEQRDEEVQSSIHCVSPISIAFGQFVLVGLVLAPFATQHCLALMFALRTNLLRPPLFVRQPSQALLQFGM